MREDTTAEGALATKHQNVEKFKKDFGENRLNISQCKTKE